MKLNQRQTYPDAGPLPVLHTKHCSLVRHSKERTLQGRIGAQQVKQAFISQVLRENRVVQRGNLYSIDLKRSLEHSSVGTSSLWWMAWPNYQTPFELKDAVGPGRQAEKLSSE